MVMNYMLARVLQGILVIFTMLVASPILGCITLYFFLLGWFTNESENEKLNKFIGHKHLTPKLLFNFAMGNIVIQFLMGAIFVKFLWGIFVMLIFGFSLFHGIFSTKGRIGRVW